MEMKFKSSVSRLIGYALLHAVLAFMIAAGVTMALINWIVGRGSASKLDTTTIVWCIVAGAVGLVAAVVFVCLRYNIEIVVDGNGKVSFYRMGKEYRVIQAADVIKAQTIRRTYMFIPVESRHYLFAQDAKGNVREHQCFAFGKKTFGDLYAAVQMSEKAAQAPSA